MQSMDFSHKKNKLSIIQRAKFKGGGGGGGFRLIILE